MKAIHRRWGLQAWALVRALPLETPGHPSAPRGVGGTHCGEVMENAMDGGAWWATVHGVAKRRTRPSDFSI